MKIPRNKRLLGIQIVSRYAILNGVATDSRAFFALRKALRRAKNL